MINVEAEVSKYKNCKDRDELVKLINEYKRLALKHANSIVAAGQYNMVAFKLQEICEKLPVPQIKNLTSSTSHVPVKTAAITNEENARISAAWNERAGSKRKK